MSAPGHVRIVKTPFGEAPDWVRDAWVGLTLPLLQPGLKTLPQAGVLSGAKPAWAFLWDTFMGKPTSATGYVVPAARAIAVLADKNPKAAAWWREHAPKFLKEQAIFLFDAPACRPCKAPAREPLAA